jgi:hemerythrin-like metal-binding protein
VIHAGKDDAVRPFFLWKDAFRLGIAGVDEDHRRFFDLINELHAAMVRGGDRADVSGTIAELIVYTRDHFWREEQELRAMSYPHLHEHESQHRYFMRELERMAQQPTPSPLRALALARDWLLEHILGADRKVAVWLARTGGTR